MNRKDHVILGINHQFLFPGAVSDAGVHTQTLELLAGDNRFDALDFWISAGEPNRGREIKSITNSGKYLNYNIGDRYGQRTMIPASPDPDERNYALETMKRETGMALECGASKIIFGSGPDFPKDRDEAKKRLAGFIFEAFRDVPQSVLLAMEPTDRSLDKFFLFGPFDESAQFSEEIRKQGMKNFTLLVDMGHIPLLGVSLEKALDQARGNIGHIHLGNCIVKDKQHPLYGDKHVPWGFPGGEYTGADVNKFVGELNRIGYFDLKNKNTVSFEMRPYEELGPEKSADKFIEIFNFAWDSIENSTQKNRL
jgi:sugar phosphate isomerase/epimerase